MVLMMPQLQRRAGDLPAQHPDPRGRLARNRRDVLFVRVPSFPPASSLIGILRTFFGGSDSSWSTPHETYTYFRNIQLYGGTGASKLKGKKVSAAACARGSWTTAVAALACTFLASVFH
jgi:hypothetical protein